MPASSFERLNEMQRRAVEYGHARPATSGWESGPLLIIAGAGTGKTNTLAHRVAWLVLAGVEPDRILLLTFTRRAAQEMTRRAQRIVDASLRERAASEQRRAAALGRHVSLDRQPAAAPVRAQSRPRPGLHACSIAAMRPT